MEDIPYRRLKSSRPHWWVLSCFRREKEEKLTPEIAVVRLTEAIKTIDMKTKNLNFQINELHNEARQMFGEDRVKAREMLVLVKKIKHDHAVLVKFWGNLHHVRSQLENTATISSVASSMETANAMLTQALGDLGVHSIEDLMADLREHTLDVNHLSETLGEPVVEFDIDAELAALEDDEIVLPDVNVKIKKEKRQAVLG